MTLVIDKRNEVQNQPGLHVLIVGVSAYPALPSGTAPGTPESLGLRQLSCTALSAYHIYNWIKDHTEQLAVPLATVRLLLSPSAEEKQAEPALDGLAEGATLEAFLRTAQEWRRDAATNRDNVTFFYFAGHGAQRTKDDAVILLEDFGDGLGGPLRNAVDIGNIFKGMAESADAPNMAQTQFYFVDACRDFLRAFRDFEPDQASQVFRVPLTGEDRRSAPIFFAAVPGTKAYALVGEQTFFSKVLLSCLANDAADIVEVAGQDRWCISVYSLGKVLNTVVANLNEQHNVEQEIVPGGWVREAILCFLQQPPMVPVELIVEPATALPCVQLKVVDGGGQAGPPLPDPLAPNPFTATWPAGYYTIQTVLKTTPCEQNLVIPPSQVRAVRPPRFRQRVRMTA